MDFSDVTLVKKHVLAGQWWHTPLIPTLGRKRYMDLCGFKASLLYRVSSRAARTTQGNPVSKNQKEKKKERKREREKEEGGGRGGFRTYQFFSLIKIYNLLS